MEDLVATADQAKRQAKIADRRALYASTHGANNPRGTEPISSMPLVEDTAAGIPFSIEPRLVPFASIEHRRRRDNDLITLHACTAAWKASHAETGLAGQGAVAKRQPHIRPRDWKAQQ